MNHKKQLFRNTVIASLLTPLLVHSTGFQLFEQSANSLGYGHADMAALADDAATAYYNPAGMTRLSRPEVVFGGTFADIEATFDGRANFHLPFPNTNIFFTLFNLVPFAIYSQNFGASFAEAQLFSNKLTDSGAPIDNQNVLIKVPRAKSSTHPAIPFFHFVTPVYRSCDIDVAAGLSLAAPFGLETDYSGTYVQSYTAENEYVHFAINPSIAARYKSLSIGVGLIYSFLKDTYTIRTLNTGGDVFFSNTDTTLRRINLDWESRLWNWNIGALYELSPHLRFGLTYRPRYDFRQKGDINIVYTSGKAKAIFHIPDTITAGFYGDITSKWALMGTFTFTFWHKFQEVVVKTTIPPFNIAISGLEVYPQEFNVPLQFKNAALFALGTKYTIEDDLWVKFGLSYDRSPTQRNGRELRIPDNDRYGISTGFHYDVNCHLAFDVAYQFLYLPKANIKNNPTLIVDTNLPNNEGITLFPKGSGVFNGTVKTIGQIFSMQASWKF